MKEIADNLQNNIGDIILLLDLSKTNMSIDQRNVIYRSAIVLLVASWEQYVEQTAEGSVALLTDRLRDFSPLPEKVKQSISISIVSEKRNNKRLFSDSVWRFANKGWKEAYKDYCLQLTSKLNTASPDNVINLYQHILGIRNITNIWKFKEMTPEECREMLLDIIHLRHDIAHGKNSRIDELEEKKIRHYIEFVCEIAESIYTSVFSKLTELSYEQALTYSLANNYCVEIINFASGKSENIISLKEIKKLGSSSQGNHNKLRYSPWALLGYINKSTRHISDRLRKFSADEILLPLEILVFDNKEAIPKPNTKQIAFSQIIEMLDS